MKNYIFAKIKGVLIKEEANNSLMRKNCAELLLSNHAGDLYSIENDPCDVCYVYSISSSLYELIVTNENCGEDLINLLQFANGNLQLGVVIFKDLRINVVAEHPSRTYGVDVSISFEVSYKGTFVERLTPSSIPGTAADLKEYLLLLLLLLQDEVDSEKLV